MSKFDIIETDDGSFTIKNQLFDETYHSVFGAISESNYVFIDAGFLCLNKKEFSVFEVGFGTGINALLSLKASVNFSKKVHYTAIEKYVVENETINKLTENFDDETDKSLFKKITNAKWNENVEISENFELLKIEADFTEYDFVDSFDLIYFDAFSFETQAEMWSEKMFKKLFDAMNENGILVTYSSKGEVKRNLRSAGFIVKRLKGFKKRHMLRAIKK